MMLLSVINRDINITDHFRAQNADSPSPVYACPCPQRHCWITCGFFDTGYDLLIEEEKRSEQIVRL